MTDFAVPPGPQPDRRADIDAKHREVARLLEELDAEGLLALDPANVAWLTAGAAAHPGTERAETPAVYFSANARWAICSSLDTQALFDDQLDGLGFQLKEWAWPRGRDALLAEVTQGRRVVSDTSRPEGLPVIDTLAKLRRRLSARERGQMLDLGADLAHALEATGRNCAAGETERQVGGQLAHRLMQRGLAPVAVTVSADDRARRLRRHACSAEPVRRLAVLQATACRDGLFATAARVVSFGEPGDQLRADFDAALRLATAWHAASRADAPPAEVFAAGAAALPKGGDAETDWLAAPAGWVTGRRPVEVVLTPRSPEPLRAGWAVGWSARCGAAVCADTLLVSADGAAAVTPPSPDGWPVRRAKLAGQTFDRPDVLVRDGPAG